MIVDLDIVPTPFCKLVCILLFVPKYANLRRDAVPQLPDIRIAAYLQSSPMNIVCNGLNPIRPTVQINSRLPGVIAR